MSVRAADVEERLTVCIVGLGLMGGSLALALRRQTEARAGSASPDRSLKARAPRLPVQSELPSRLAITGVARRRETLEAALAAGAIDDGTTDLAAGVAHADVVILATPVRTILRLLPEVGACAAPGATILDLGSTKAQICAAMADLPAAVEPVGGHPMCGKEVGGFAAADPNLYRGRTFVLCPLERTSPRALSRAAALAEAAGSQPLIMDPAVHDRAAGAVSHLPYAVAVALVSAVAETPAAWPLAASGLRDTTRLAASDVEMMADILLTNREAVLRGLDALATHLGALRSALDSGNEQALRAQLTAAQSHRRAIGLAAGWQAPTPGESGAKPPDGAQ